MDTSTAAGKAFLDMLAVSAEFETNLRRERQAEEIVAAKDRDVHKGRIPVIDAGEVRRLHLDEKLSPTAIAKRLGIARSSVYKFLPGAGTAPIHSIEEAWSGSPGEIPGQEQGEGRMDERIVESAAASLPLQPGGEGVAGLAGHVSMAAQGTTQAASEALGTVVTPLDASTGMISAAVISKDGVERGTEPPGGGTALAADRTEAAWLRNHHLRLTS